MIPSRLLRLMLLLLLNLPLPLHASPRLIVTTDIGGDPDDMQSLIRLLTFSNAFELEALIASASGTPNELDQSITRPDLVRRIVDAYAEVYPNLRDYAPGYPAPESLRERIHSGNPNRGWDQVGESHDSPGSEALLDAMLKPDPRPLHIAIWGGQTDLAQALWRLKQSRADQDYHTIVRKLRIHDIADQDGLFERLIQDHPTLFYILNRAPEGSDKRNAVFRGMYLGGDEQLTSREWVDRHVRLGHGDLGALYPIETWTAPNPHGVLKEGDTPSWFYFLDNGLHPPDQPSWGGWGGRFQPHPSGYSIDAIDTVEGHSSARASVWRWRSDFQHAFAARMDACVLGAQANHPPCLHLKGQPERYPILELPAGESIPLDLSESHDPDGDALLVDWIPYPEAGDPGVMVEPRRTGPLHWELHALPNSAAGTAHLILRLTDDGDPPLTAYRRIRVAVIRR